MQLIIGEQVMSDSTNSPPIHVMDNKLRSLLKRQDPFEVPGSYAWATRLISTGQLGDVSRERVIALAPLAASIREESPYSLGKLMKKSGIKERHVQRLLASEREDINEQLEKTVRLLGRKANVLDVVKTALYWGDRKRRELAMDYFGSENEALQEDEAAA